MARGGTNRPATTRPVSTFSARFIGGAGLGRAPGGTPQPEPGAASNEPDARFGGEGGGGLFAIICHSGAFPDPHSPFLSDEAYSLTNISRILIIHASQGFSPLTYDVFPESWWHGGDVVSPPSLGVWPPDAATLRASPGDLVPTGN